MASNLEKYIKYKIKELNGVYYKVSPYKIYSVALPHNLHCYIVIKEITYNQNAELEKLKVLGHQAFFIEDVNKAEYIFNLIESMIVTVEQRKAMLEMNETKGE
jgi:hypothetical protein